MQGSPGFTKSTIDISGSKVSLMSENSKLCTILMDEMSLKSNLFYDSSKDIVGVEDFGDGKRSKHIANSALVFVVRGVTDNWKQPLCYCLTNQSCRFEAVMEKLMEVIDKIKQIPKNRLMS